MCRNSVSFGDLIKGGHSYSDVMEVGSMTTRGGPNQGTNSNLFLLIRAFRNNRQEELKGVLGSLKLTEEEKDCIETNGFKEVCDDKEEQNWLVSKLLTQ